MNLKQFIKYVARDGGCVHCGDVDTAVPNHRIGRGMGGSKDPKRLNPSNIITLCSVFNGLIESDVDAMQEAIARGWKLKSWQDPTLEPVYDYKSAKWWLLTDDYRRIEADEHNKDRF